MEETVDTTTQQTRYSLWQHFSKRTLILIGVLVIITAGLLYLAIRQEQPAPVSGPIPTPKISHAYSTLSLLSQTTSTASSQTVAIQVTSNQNQISGAQINLAYDPTVLGNVTVQIGNYFTRPNVLLNTIDRMNGQITLVLGIQPGATQASGSGTIATLSYTLLPTTKKTTEISFLPKTTLTQEGELDTVLKKSINLTIQIPQTAQQVRPLPASSSAQ